LGIPVGGVPASIPVPPMEHSRKGIRRSFGIRYFAHPGLWFLFGCMFVISLIFLIEYLGRKKDRED